MKNEPTSISAAGISSQKLRLFMRAKAMSAAPICSGIIQFAKPTKAGMIAPNTMIRPCIVVSWLNSSGLTNCRPGLEQLGADQQRQHAADHEHGEREQQVHRADVLVVGREQPAAPAVRAPWSWSWSSWACVAGVVEDCAHGVIPLARRRGSSVYLRAAATSAGCTSWPVLLRPVVLGEGDHGRDARCRDSCFHDGIAPLFCAVAARRGSACSCRRRARPASRRAA